MCLQRRKLIFQLIRNEAENKPLYDLLVMVLGWLAEARDLALTTRYYELQLLGMAGYQLELFDCVVNAEKVIAEDQFFSPADGGVVCAAWSDGACIRESFQ